MDEEASDGGKEEEGMVVEMIAVVEMVAVVPLSLVVGWVGWGQDRVRSGIRLWRTLLAFLRDVCAKEQGFYKIS